MKALCMWSAGKDSCFACYKALASGHEIAGLLHFTNPEAQVSLAHRLGRELVSRQASSLGIPLISKAMPRENYRDEFIEIILELKKHQGIQGIVFGDIYLQEHRDWIEAVCAETSMEAVFPLWGQDTKKLAREMIEAGFRAVVVAVNAEVLEMEWLGREFDKCFLEALPEEVDRCGEKGEFHTFVFDGPFFKESLSFSTGEILLKDKNWFLEILPAENRRNTNE